MSRPATRTESSRPIPFVKMQGIGNDFVMLDLIGGEAPAGDPADLSRRLNDRRFGVGGDGLIFVERGARAPFKMRMFNPDGSESQMCGNGIRCFARLLRDRGYLAGDRADVETGAGLLSVALIGDGPRVRVGMGRARFEAADLPMAPEISGRFLDRPVGLGDWRGTAVSMGNPHLVLFADAVEEVPVAELGPELERSPLFPERVNVHFVQVLDRGRALQRTWERGAGLTLACGTGACAVVAAGVETGRFDREVEVLLPGGSLTIEYAEDGEVWMTGPAETVFEGVWDDA